MREMKDSGIPWIGKIPQNWKLKKGKYLFTQRNTRGNRRNLHLLSPTQQYGVISQKEYEKLTGMKAVKLKEDTDLSQLKTIHAGDYCISLRSFQGGFEYCKTEGVVSPAYQVFYAIVPSADIYYKYLFKDEVFISKMNSFTMSLRDGKNIAFSDFGNTLIPYPPLTEQQAIADYLDAKCADIDGITRDIEEQIETLKEYKKSVITHAVTKGLDPHAEMKDSGIEWIGNIPKGWKTIKIKYLPNKEENSYVDGDWIESPVITDEGIKYYTTGNIGDGYFKVQGNGHISDETFTALHCKFAYAGDLIFSRLNAPYGRSCILPQFIDKCVLAVDNVILRTDENKRYICYVTQCTGYQKNVEDQASGTTMKRISRTKLGSIKIPLPPCIEQQAIADYLDAKCADIDGAISEKQEQLETLKEYKKSLIYEYVTGKKEVPHE